jgi:hypothetical protein
MGASTWTYVVPYKDDLEAALDDLRRQVFEKGDFVGPAADGLPDAASIDDLLMQDYYLDFMRTTGTHSIIDVVRVVPAGSGHQEYGTIRPLTGDETFVLFGVSRPSRADFDAVRWAELDELVAGGRGTGRAVVLWTAGQPTEIAFWGYSGD